MATTITVGTALYKAEQDGATGAYTPHSQPEVAGSAVSSTNPLPVQQRNGITITQTIVTLTAGQDAQLIAANTNRRYLAICNISTGDATIAFNQSAQVGAGWPLPAANSPGAEGGAMTWEGTGVSTDAIHAISGVGTTIAVLEGI